MARIAVDSRFVFGHPAHFIAFGFGSGLAPVAPGTFGSLVGIPLTLWLLPAYGDLGVRRDEFTLRRVSHSLERIAKQIYKNLLDLDTIHQYQIVFRIEIKAKLDAQFASAGKPECAGLFNQF